MQMRRCDVKDHRAEGRAFEIVDDTRTLPRGQPQLHRSSSAPRMTAVRTAWYPPAAVELAVIKKCKRPFRGNLPTEGVVLFFLRLSIYKIYRKLYTDTAAIFNSERQKYGCRI